MRRSGTFKADELVPVRHGCGGQKARDLETYVCFCRDCGETWDDDQTAEFRKWKASQS